MTHACRVTTVDRRPRRAARRRARRLPAPAPALAPPRRAARAQPRRPVRRAAQRRLDQPRPGRPRRRSTPCACAPAPRASRSSVYVGRQVPAHDRLRRARRACGSPTPTASASAPTSPRARRSCTRASSTSTPARSAHSMVEGRISAGVVVGDGSDIGGGASIMGTLSGGGKAGHLDRRALPARRQRRPRASRSATTASSRPGSTSPPARA